MQQSRELWAHGDSNYAGSQRGLAAGATYRVHMVERGATMQRAAEALEREGIALSLGEFASEIIWIERAAG